MGWIGRVNRRAWDRIEVRLFEDDDGYDDVGDVFVRFGMTIKQIGIPLATRLTIAPMAYFDKLDEEDINDGTENGTETSDEIGSEADLEGPDTWDLETRGTWPSTGCGEGGTRTGGGCVDAEYDNNADSTSDLRDGANAGRGDS